MIKFPTIRTVEDLEAFEQSFAVSFDATELRAAIFHISDAYRSQGDHLEDLTAERDVARQALAEIVQGRPGWREAARRASEALAK